MDRYCRLRAAARDRAWPWKQAIQAAIRRIAGNALTGDTGIGEIAAIQKITLLAAGAELVIKLELGGHLREHPLTGASGPASDEQVLLTPFAEFQSS